MNYLAKKTMFLTGRLLSLLLGGLLFFVLFNACSSAPKRPNETFTDRDAAAKQLNLAIQAANRGRYEDALSILGEARRLAVSADDTVLRIKTSISRGNFLFPLGKTEEAFGEWDAAAAEADAEGEQVLASLARIYTIRASLLQGETNAEEMRTLLEGHMAAVRPDASAIAAGNVTMGIAEKQAGRWAEAESAIKRALDYHERNLNLEEAAYDWFLIASVRSVAGSHEGALEALRQAIRLDRRAENGYGLASSWQAMGEVLQKAGRLAESKEAFSRAAEIYRSIGLTALAEKLENQL